MPPQITARALPIVSILLVFCALGVVARSSDPGSAPAGKAEIRTQQGAERPGASQPSVHLPAPGSAAIEARDEPAAADSRATGILEPPVELRELSLPIDFAETRIRPAPTVEEVFEEEELDLLTHRIEWGQMLFHDPRLSAQGNLACASCHVQTALGTRWARVPMNTETENLFVSFDPHLFWDPDMTELDPDEPEVEERVEHILGLLQADDRYQVDLGGETETLPADLDEIAELLLSFSLSEVPDPTPFDEYLRGDAEAISLEARQGFELFCRVGCNDCHFGWGLGGRAFQKLGRANDYFADRGKVTGEDLGRFNETGDDGDRYLFRVPRLRGLPERGPYYHDGSQATLGEAVWSMGYYQLDEELRPAEVQAIVAFIKSVQAKGASQR